MEAYGHRQRARRRNAKTASEACPSPVSEFASSITIAEEPACRGEASGLQDDDLFASADPAHPELVDVQRFAELRGITWSEVETRRGHVLGAPR